MLQKYGILYEMTCDHCSRYVHGVAFKVATTFS